MNSRLSGSEEALAVLRRNGSWDARPAHPDRRPRHGLYAAGGVGLVSTDARIVVAELVPQVVAWARGPMASLFAGCLDDARAELAVSDVGALIAAAQVRYDAILLDVEQRPGRLTVATNDALYDEAGLAAARMALTPAANRGVVSRA